MFVDRYGFLPGVAGVDVDNTFSHFAAAELGYELCGPFSCHDGKAGIEAFLEPGRGLAAEFELLAAVVDSGLVEIGGFQQNSGGVFTNL